MFSHKAQFGYANIRTFYARNETSISRIFNKIIGKFSSTQSGTAVANTNSAVARLLEVNAIAPGGRAFDRSTMEDIMQTVFAAAEPRGKLPFYRHLYVQV
ncbi:MAG: hypothetical protein E5V16_23740, partial [Mesorhizobium sp.]